jgi:AAA15 family ATPase/GTPase
MIKSFSLENFRVFREKTTFNFRPITILTGPNSSGKSSLSNALYLMHKTLGDKSYTEIGDFPYDLKTSAEDIHLGDIDQFRTSGSGDLDVTFGFTYDNLFSHMVVYTKYMEKKPRGILIPLCKDIYIEYTYSKVLLDDEMFKSIKNNELIQKTYLKKYQVCHNGVSVFTGVLDKPGLFAKDYFMKLKCNYSLISEILIENLESYVVHYLINGDVNSSKIINDLSVLDFRYSKVAPPLAQLQAFTKNLSGLLRLSGGCSEKFSLEAVIYRNEGVDIVADLWDRLKSRDMVKQEIREICRYNQLYHEFSIEEAVDEIIDFIQSNKNTPETTLKMLNEINILHYDVSNKGLGIAYSVLQMNDLKYTDLYFFMRIEYMTSRLFPEAYSFLRLLDNYAVILYHEIMNLFTENLIQILFFNSISPIKSRVIRREDNIAFVKLLREYFASLEWNRTMAKRSFTAESDENLNVMNSLQFINYWIQKLGIGKEINAEYIADSELFKLEVVKEDGKSYNLMDLGTGVRQIIFMLLAICRNIGKNRTILIEEPENNLHPAYQSKLADIFVHAYNRSNHLIVETHSEYLIRKLQYLVAKGECNPKHIVIYYIDDPDPAKRAPGAPQVREITLDKNGRMSQDFGPGFFDEADNLAIQLFNFNQQNPN